MQKQPMGLTHCLHRKGPLQTSDQIPNVDPTRDAVNLGVGGLQEHGIGSRRLVYKKVTPWHDQWAITCACAVTRANQEK